jgi:hypothetical protein
LTDDKYFESYQDNNGNWHHSVYGPNQAPPLGLKPKRIHDELRKAEIKAAMERYSKASKLYPAEWLLELDQLEFVDDSHIPVKADCGELLGEHGAPIRKMGEKPKSIWKSVKELPIFKSDSNSAYSIIMELKHDNRKIYGIYSWSMEEEAHFYDMEMDEIYQEDISRYCILTDYINYIESFENRIKKLEEK